MPMMSKIRLAPDLGPHATADPDLRPHATLGPDPDPGRGLQGLQGSRGSDHRPHGPGNPARTHHHRGRESDPEHTLPQSTHKPKILTDQPIF
ncbi:hypothetical protein SVEN_3162 [Streptomyces venezuelae ATCC 10712]|uniref:Uncharacterized protein n=1 Tax=Streptomyces venezuelae (strain ATCC 10712 / CBS 650.69 / DSM 40230 / JCM 4526 / NBRC 13096 / PD 04745) TaxID=953739 RepID=F2R8Y8_STRVP|nr:hypothetical protein SVEN_3162 [Streptomyces venezuelae ATCC 10712]